MYNTHLYHLIWVWRLDARYNQTWYVNIYEAIYLGLFIWRCQFHEAYFNLLTCYLIGLDCTNSKHKRVIIILTLRITNLILLSLMETSIVPGWNAVIWHISSNTSLEMSLEVSYNKILKTLRSQYHEYSYCCCRDIVVGLLDDLRPVDQWQANTDEPFSSHVVL